MKTSDSGTTSPHQPDTKAPRSDALLARTFARIRDRCTGLHKPVTLPWLALNRVLGGGLWPGMHILTGNSGAGKTQWALQVALHAALDGIPTLFVTLDLDESSFIARLTALLTAERWSDLYLGRSTDLPMVERIAKERLRAIPLHVELADPANWNATQLSERLIALRKQYESSKEHSPLVVVDYLQMVGDDTDPSRPGVAQAAFDAARLVRGSDATLILISMVAQQFSHLASLEREREGGRLTPIPLTDEGPNISPGKLLGIGEKTARVEYAADTVLALCREPFTLDSPSEDAWIAVAKLRAGTPTWVHLTFDGTRFD